MSIAAELRERILAAPDLHRELVEVPEWGVSLYVRVMTARERDAFEAQQLTLAKQDRGTDNIRARLVVLTAVDEQGARVSGDADADALGNKAVSAMDRLANVAMRINRFTASDIEELKGN
jgi:hypothetical protein